MHSPRNELITEERKRFKKKFDGDVSLCEKEKLTTTKPKIVADYNKHMGYVDLGDRMSSTYSFARRTRKWTKKLFFSLIDIAVLNAFLMFKSCRTSSKFSLKEFRMNLITSLIGKINHKNAEHSVTKKVRTNDNTFSHWPFDEKKRRKQLIGRANRWCNFLGRADFCDHGGELKGSSLIGAWREMKSTLIGCSSLSKEKIKTKGEGQARMSFLGTQRCVYLQRRTVEWAQYKIFQISPKNILARGERKCFIPSQRDN
ncbi:piggyBac transposable element-derived protein 4 [Trichonephila clavipes]|nr:piggyBac transposable element-derived protein 4 [Trichonephila clavipes]